MSYDKSTYIINYPLQIDGSGMNITYNTYVPKR